MDQRRYPVGAEPLGQGVHFRVWGPDCRKLAVVINENEVHELKHERDGYFSVAVDGVRVGATYQFQLENQDLVPDPASRFQPQGVHGPSQVVDPGRFRWTDDAWHGQELAGLVVYEMHIGSFTPEGTWDAATRELPELAELGVNCIELMPVAEFRGEFGWGYDGVDLFAPTRLYGTPDDFRNFVNAAHANGIAVILDVVYNHLGPEGNYLGKFAAAYFTDRYKTDWGAAINFDGADSAPVREYFLTNAAYWIQDFHLDGLRIDATQNIYDAAPLDRHILTQIGQQARAAAAGRTILLIAENEPQHPELCRAVDQGGYGLDAVWNDDYHHSAMVALTGHREAYYTDYFGNPQEFISAAKYGYLFQGQWYSWQDNRRGRSGLDLPRPAFITFIQNHDQVANSGRGLRAHQQSSPARYRAFTALTLLMPGTPMLFQGQEFAASTPFLYFADHGPELAALVQAGRAEFLSQFSSLTDERIAAHFARPDDPQTFQRCKLDFSERTSHTAEYQLTKDLLKLRRTAPGFQPESVRGVDGATISPNAFVLRYFFEDGQDRLLVVNLGRDLELAVVPEPLLAPPYDMQWRVLLSTEEPQYGGNGVRSPECKEGGWFIPAEVAMVLVGEPRVAFVKSDPAATK
jgi:maltooligosyltrehalose trehalohydrolase